MDRNVLYISYDGMTDPLGQSQVIPYLSGLAKIGYRITILSCEKPDNFAAVAAKIESLLQEAGITWRPVSYTKRPPVLSTIYDYRRIKKLALQLHHQNSFDLIHCRSYISSMIGLWFAQKKKVPFIFDMRGFWPDERVDGGLWKLSNPLYKLIYRFFKKKEIAFLQESAAVISLTQAGKNEIFKWPAINIPSEKVTVIPCCVDTALFDPASIRTDVKEKLKASLGIAKGDVIIGYLGSIGTWYLLDDMLKFFVEFKKSVPAARLLFVTHDQVNLREKATTYNIKPADLIITSAQRDDVPGMISLFTYGLFFIKPSYSKTASSPTKQGEIMAMGKPVICNSGVGDTDMIVETYKSGVLVKNNDFQSSVTYIASHSTYNPQNIRDGAIDYFSLEKGVAGYRGVYQEILNSTKIKVD